MDRLEALEKNLNITLGRVNGLHSLLYTIARELPPEVAAKCAESAEAAKEKIIADRVAAPVPDDMINEMNRVVAEGIFVLKAAAKQQG